MRKIFFFFLLLSTAMSGSLFAAIPQPGEGLNLDHELGGRAKVYVSEEEREAFSDEAARADAVFVASIESAILSRVGLGGAPVPMTRLNFSTPEFLKGGPFSESSFLYRKSPDSLQSYRNIPVIVILKKSSGASYFVENFLPADKANIAMVRAVLAGKIDCAEEEPVCGE